MNNVYDINVTFKTMKIPSIALLDRAADVMVHSNSLEFQKASLRKIIINYHNV